MKSRSILAAALGLVLAGAPAAARGGMELAFSTFLGGASLDTGYGIALSSSGEVYVAGSTMSSNFPTANPWQPGFPGSNEAFLSKFSSSGSTLLCSTYLGGSGGTDQANGLALDGESSVYLVGYTMAPDFPTRNAYQAEFNAGTDFASSYDAFLSKFSSSGSDLVFSTFLGGSRKDWGSAVAVDSLGRVYACGYTLSLDFPTQLAFQSAWAGGNADVFFAKFAPSGDTVYFSTYLGGAGDDKPEGIAVDSSHRAYLAGYTYSDDFPTLNAYQGYRASGGAPDFFVTRFAAPLAWNLSYSTYLGGGSDDKAQGIAVDSDGCAYVSGYSGSSNFPTANPYQAAARGYDAVALKLSSAGDLLLYSTYLGGADTEFAYGFALDSAGTACLTGVTLSIDFPTVDPYQATFAGGTGYDAFVARVSASGSSLIFSTYLGGAPEYDWGKEIAAGEDGACAVTGYTYSPDFPTLNAYQPSLASSQDAFVSVFLPDAAGRAQYHTDFDGDGTSDIALFRPATGQWAVRDVTRVYLGSSLDEPAPADYDGDRTTEIATFRPENGLWAIRDLTRAYFGGSGDLARPGDYDGDGAAEIALFRDGLWAVRDVTRVYFGAAGDQPASGYYDADRVLDLAVFRDGTGLWSLRNVSRIYFGQTGDRPVPSDYRGDGLWKAAVFRPADGMWRIRDLTTAYLGSESDATLPADYDGDGTDEIAIFRPSSTLWAVRDLTRVYFGSSGDEPVSR